jgi:cytochrome c biogenesis protein CcmG, thiol:disulfide interchange protein DsbE
MAAERRRFLGVGLLAAASGGAVLLTVAQRQEAAPPREALVGQPAPHFTLPSLREAALPFSPSQMRGRVWVLNVWASWCAQCRDEHALLLALARAGHVPLIGLNSRDDPRSAEEWLRRLGDPYLATVLDRDGLAGRAWGVDGVPVSFVVDREGIVRHHHRGALTQAVWDAELQPLLRRLAP